MKTFKALLTIGLLTAVAIGCSTTKSRENMLSAAGFKAMPADTTERQQHLTSLPADKITTVQRNGSQYYVFPDPKQNVLYVGQEQQYQQYRKLRLEKQMADEELATSMNNDDAAWGVWGAWPARGWVWR
jgi:hypothetical protein